MEEVEEWFLVYKKDIHFFEQKNKKSCNKKCSFKLGLKCALLFNFLKQEF